MTIIKRRYIRFGGSRWSIVSVIAGCLLFSFTASAVAGGKDWPTMDHHRYEDDRHGYDSRGRGGWWVGAFSPELGSLNDKLVDHGFGALDGTLLMFGGGGAGWKDHWSFGGFGGGGSVSSTKGDTRAVLSAGFGGMEVARKWSIGEVGLDAGAFFGGGGTRLHLTHSEPSSTDDFDPHDTVFDRGFFAVGPTVGAQVDFADHIGFRVKAGYLFTLGDEWTHTGSGQVVTGLPDMSGPFFTIGLTFGR